MFFAKIDSWAIAVYGAKTIPRLLKLKFYVMVAHIKQS